MKKTDIPGAAFAWICVAAGVSLLLAEQPDSIPSWLDTIPPEITIMPQEKYQREIFHISLEADEVATILFGINSAKNLEVYRRPISITTEGKITVYFRGEDDFGNTSPLDSMGYVLDRRAPQLRYSPEPGRYSRKITVRLLSDEPVQFFFHRGRDDVSGKPVSDSLTVAEWLEGFFSAVDKAGNRTISDSVRYIVDTTKIRITCSPSGGIFNEFEDIAVSVSPDADIYYTFDPSAPADWFDAYEEPVTLSYGLNVLRYFARTPDGAESEIYRAKYVVDTIPPTVRFDFREGTVTDTVALGTRERASIWYTLDGKVPTPQSIPYTGPVVVRKTGRSIIRARARDRAGNISPPFDWEQKYDTIPPVVSLSHHDGLYATAINVEIGSNEKARIYYTLDGTEPTDESFLYNGPLSLTKQGKTVLACFGVDMAGNASAVVRAAYTIDTEPPVVQARIEQNIEKNIFSVDLYADEPVKIFYERGGKIPTLSSPRYSGDITMRGGEMLKYFAVDSAGNRSPVRLMEDLRRPMVAASPGGGIFNRKLKIGFVTNITSSVKWRLLPDTAFRTYGDSVLISRQGTHSLEYYSVTPDGMQSPFHRNEYVVDWTSPQVTVTLRRGIDDSVSVFFNCSENATIYYTTDGTSPLFSQSVRMAGNKFLSSQDRISVKRRNDIRLSFYAEDIAGNQSGLSIYDLSKPRVTPNVPSGTDRVYNRFLTISFNTLDDRSQIYYSHHGNTPTVDSTLYSQPITLLRSDTLVAFVMDASGFKGDLDTFIYHIDLPPSARFTVSPDTVFSREIAVFDAAATVDQETVFENLFFRWDFDGDGAFDTEFENKGTHEHVFTAGGLYAVTLEVRDEAGRIGTSTRNVGVHELCPAGMRYVIDRTGRSFCIDTYEWPNVQNKKPET
ncbi:MAG: hypothetical protein GF350_07645, partial [Chitinivibrionales bacterium]|nr:hypothetical protein [Chitinivibrionales bacterium]